MDILPNLLCFAGSVAGGALVATYLIQKNKRFWARFEEEAIRLAAEHHEANSRPSPAGIGRYVGNYPGFNLGADTPEKKAAKLYHLFWANGALSCAHPAAPLERVK